MTSPSDISPKPGLNGTAIVRPHTLNFQAIDLCNSRCIMCNIWKDGRREQLSLDELQRELAHPFYGEVRHVGITGGEPTLRKDLTELYELLPQCLPKLTGASFITHGMQTERAVEILAEVHTRYRSLNLTFDGMVSLDGVGAVHDQVRGRAGAFDAATKTLLQLKARGVGVIAACTIVRSNVYGLHDLLDWGKAHGVYVRFRVAEFIRRLYNDSCAAEIRGFNPRELRHLVSFYHVLLEEYETNETVQKTYHSILSLLTGGNRLIGCPYQKGRDVNVDSTGRLACCAPKGVSFAPAPDASEVHAVLAAQRREVAGAYCANCIHDYHDDWNEIVAEEINQSRVRSQELYEAPEERLTTPELAAQPLDLAGLKQILLAGWYGTETAGDIAILEGIINEYLAVNPQLEFQVLSFFPYYTRTTVALWPEAVRTRVRVIAYASEAAGQATLDCDAVVMAGGPLMDIGETRKILCLFKRFADLGKPRVIEGCGVGPLNCLEFRWNVCRIARLATKISVRDSASRDALRSYGIRKPIEVRLDPAVTFIRAQGIRHHGADKKIIRCFLRELTCEYPQAISSAQATQNLETLLTRLLAWYPDHQIELWAMHHFPVGKDDRLFARQLVKQIANPRLICDWEPRTPKEILEAMAAADFCVCMRFHSCVFATEVGVPFLAIDYTAGGKIKAFFDDIRQESRVCGLADLPRLDKDQFEAKVRFQVTGELQPATVSQVATSSKPPRILHLIQNLVGGGGARAMISLAKHSARLAGYEHRLVSLGAADSVGLELARQANLSVLNQPVRNELFQAMADADIVLVHWWNNPDLATLFRRELPPMRLALWLHVGGYHPPQVFSRSLIDFADLTVACSPHTYAHPVFTNLPDEFRQQRTAMVLAGAEFDRLQGVTPLAHAGFQVGYIGTVDPVKMHSEFVNMSCAVNVPQVKFIVCGNGDFRWLANRSEELGRLTDFDFRGPVEDIRSVLETLDVYGYPLCPDTYAAAELNLQEAMFAGLPVVTFPHGGIGKLIQHGETGILVNTPEEYARAIEHLYQNPAERGRLGANAAAFARRFWGAESAAREFNLHFEHLLTQSKHARQWDVPPGASVSELPLSLADRIPQLAVHPGARLFLESLEASAQPFLDSFTSGNLEDMFEAEDHIAEMSRLMHHNGVVCYRYLYPKDPFIQLWAGLGFLHAGDFNEALEAFTLAVQHGFAHWRVEWYRALAAEGAGKPHEAVGALKKLLQAAPDFAPAREMQQRLAGAIQFDEKPPAPLVPGEAARGCVQQAERFLQAGELASAREWLVRALDLSPRQMDLMETLTELDCRLGNFEAARTGYAAIIALNPLRKSPRLENIREILGLKANNMQTNQPILSADAQSFVQAAKAALGRNDKHSALSALQRAHKIIPRHSGILAALGSLQGQTGDFAASLETLNQAASLAADDALVQVLRARVFVKLNRVEEFETALGRALEINAGFAPAHRLLGDLLAESQQPAEAVKHYRLALEHSAPEANLLLALSKCLEQCGETEAAAASHNEATQLAHAHFANSETLALLEAIVPGTALSAAGTTRVEICAPVQSRHLSSENNPMQNTFHANGSNGHSHSRTSVTGLPLNLDRNHSALAGANGVNGHHNGTATANQVGEHLKAADFHIGRGDLKSCCSSLKCAAEAAPDDVKILATLGNLCFQLGDFQEARTQFEQVLQLEPQNAVLQVQLATACQRLGDAEGFTAALKQALALDPGCEAAQALMASVHFQAKRFGEAANIYEQLLVRNPNTVEWLLPLAKCRFHLGNLRGCRELYERVRQLEPGNPVAIEALNIIQNGNSAARCVSVQDIVRENPALHRDHTGKPITMPISGAVADFIQQHVKEGARTIETGAGLSTLCFLVKGAHHTAIAPDSGLEPRLREYCRTHGMRDDRLTYIPKTSQDAVWAIEGEFDCALIDGGHGFPIPFIDFFYLNRHLKKGGFLIVDDLEIWTGETLAKFLSCERAWKFVVQDGNRAIIFQKVGDAQATEWNRQEFVVKSSLHPAYMETVIPRENLLPATAS